MWFSVLSCSQLLVFSLAKPVQDAVHELSILSYDLAKG